MFENWKDSLMNSSKHWNELFINLGTALVVFIVCIVLAKLFSGFVKNRLTKLQRFDNTLVPIFSRLSKYFVYTIGAAIILDIFGVNTASIVTLLGTIGLAIGFALKDTLSNIAAGIMLIILRPFSTGEYIQAASVEGTVMEVNLFTSILKTANGLYVSVPNGVLWGTSITNLTRNPNRRIEIIVGIDYSDSIDTAIEVLQKVVQSESRILEEPKPQTFVTALGDSSVNLSLRAWVNTADYLDTNVSLNKAVKEKIEAAGLSIPFPQTDIHIKQK